MPDAAQVSTSPPTPSSNSAHQSAWTSFLSLPAPLRTFFAHFPLQTYAPNLLPERSSTIHDLPLLYVFASDPSYPDRPSHNPSCLRWQTYLRIKHIAFHAVASNNHASPSGSLPFLLPSPIPRPQSDHKQSGKSAADKDAPVPATRIRKWVEEQQHASSQSVLGTGTTKEEVYMALLDHRIRRAWLNQLYLDPLNTPLLRRLYVDPVSRNPLVRLAVLAQLRAAAAEELRRSNPAGGVGVNEAEVLRDAVAALETLEELLGQGGEWFADSLRGKVHGDKAEEASGGPGVFDAAVFGYTHLLLDTTVMEWGSNGLGEEMRRSCPGLVRHEERIRQLCDW